MANPTTNFGWVMPTSSSLVTNLPADFNTFGQAVDTSMSELLGGTTGQVLSKTSATNMDFTWVTPTDQTPLTTKGDLFTFTTVDARLAVGNNGETLVADSSTATGLKWATPASGATFRGASVYNSTNPTIANATATLLTFNTENFDTDAYHSTSTNTGRFTIPTGYAGKYMLNFSALADASSTGKREFRFYRNGAAVILVVTMAGNEPTVQGSIVLALSETDYVEIYYTQNSGSSQPVYLESAYCRYSITYLGA